MAFRSEYRQWLDEIEPPAKPTIAERMAAWFIRPASADADMFARRDVAELIPINGDEP